MQAFLSLSAQTPCNEDFKAHDGWRTRGRRVIDAGRWGLAESTGPVIRVTGRLGRTRATFGPPALKTNCPVIGILRMRWKPRAAHKNRIYGWREFGGEVVLRYEAAHADRLKFAEEWLCVIHTDRQDNRGRAARANRRSSLHSVQSSHRDIQYGHVRGR
jgi:hypothetical protein